MDRRQSCGSPVGTERWEVVVLGEVTARVARSLAAARRWARNIAVGRCWPRG